MVAIVGLGPSHDQVPWADEETWGVAWDAWAPRYGMLFEMHSPSLFAARGEDYIRRLNDMDLPVYMIEEHKDIPKSVRYPIEDVMEITGDYFGSSVAYMIGLAVLKKVPTIDLYGVDLTDDHDHQRPNLEFLLGVARGRGLKVTVPDKSLLLSRRKTDKYEGIGVIYPQRYGSL